MQQASRAITETMDREKSKEQVQVESKVAQLEALRDSGVPGLETALSALRRDLAAMAEPITGPDWTGLAELLAAPGVLDSFSDAQLRPLLLEFVNQITYTGTPTEVDITLRDGV